MFRGRVRTSRVWAARITRHRMGSGLRTKLARTVSENQTGNKRERQRDRERESKAMAGQGPSVLGEGVCFFVY